MRPAYLLLLDTAQTQARVVLTRGEDLVAERVWKFDPRHGPHVLAVIEQVLQTAGVAVSEVTRVAVVCGPGHWSLMRSGVVTALMLAEAIGAELVSVAHAALPTQIAAALRAQPTTVVAPQYTQPG